MNYEYPIKNNIVLFQKGPLSNWWGGFSGQSGGFNVPRSVIQDLSGDKIQVTSDLNFNCVEMWMMAMKSLLFKDYATYGKIMNTTHPKEQKALGREVKNFDSEVWDRKKFEIVSTGIYRKFEQNAELERFLLRFHPSLIFAEAAPWDKIWGIGLGPDDEKAWNVETWEGENLLGQALNMVSFVLRFT